MHWAPIEKQPQSWAVRPNLLDYAATCAGFSWDDIRRAFEGLPGGRGFNIAHEAVDRHAAGPRRDRVALRWLGSDDTVRDFTYGELAAQTNRFANILAGLGVGKGDTVAVLADRIPELYIAALGTLKNTSVFCPLFSAFGPEPVCQRLRRGDAQVLVTTERQYRQKVAPFRATLPRLRHVLLIDAPADMDDGLLSWSRLMAESSDAFVIPPTDPEDMAVLHFTSGTTGMPKGAIHVHKAALIHYMTGMYVLDFHPDDVFWCTADPGWVTGTSYGIIAPLLHGITNIVDEADFDADRWYRILEEQQVTVWYTAPTAIRRLMRLEVEPVRSYDLSRLRVIHSVGEPLNPEAVVWGQKALGLPIHDNWWQTETGGIMIANFPALDIRPGSMGRPLPGIDAAIVRRTGADAVEIIADPEAHGDLALRPGWPSMFRGYLHDEERYRQVLRRRLVPHRRPGPARWRRLLLVRRPGRRHHQDLRPHGRPVRGREHADGAPGGGRGRGHRQARPADRRARQGLCRAQTRHRTERRAAARAHRLRPQAAGVGGGAEGDRIPSQSPQEQGRQDHAPPAQGPRTGAARRRSVDIGEERMKTRKTATTKAAAVEREHGLHLLRSMIRIRRFEDKCAELYTATKIRGFLHLYDGEEAVAVGVMDALTVDDAVVATYREHGHALVRGVAAGAIMAEMYGKQEGCSRGRGGSMHLFDDRTRFYGGNAIVCAGLPLAVGLALADKMQQKRRVTCCFFGDGAVAEGEFHECLNLAALWQLPVLFVCENNLYAMGTALRYTQSVTDIAAKAASYGMAAAAVDGMDVLAVEAAAQLAAAAIRAGEGP